MSNDEKRIRTKAYKPSSPLQDEIKMGTNSQQYPRNNPNINRPVSPRRPPISMKLLGPSLPENRVPIKEGVKMKHCNRQKVEEQPMGVLKLGADLSGAIRTKMAYTPNNATEFRAKERQKKYEEELIAARARSAYALLYLPILDPGEYPSVTKEE